MRVSNSMSLILHFCVSVNDAVFLVFYTQIVLYTSVPTEIYFSKEGDIVKSPHEITSDVTDIVIEYI